MKNTLNFLCVLSLTFLFLNNAKGQSPLIATFAGDRTAGWAGDDGAATLAEIGGPNTLFIDPSGNVFIAETINNRVRMVNSSGIIFTIAGNGTPGWAGDGGAATAAEFNNPSGLAMDGAGNLYVSDAGNDVIRKISPAINGTVTTIAGIHGTATFSGDGGPASAATFYTPYGLAFDSYGNLYIADQKNSAIRKITATTDTISGSDIITTFAGHGGIHGLPTSGVLATAAYLYYPNCIYTDPYNNLYIADNGNQEIRKVNTSNIITTVAGTGTIGSSGDGGPATSAELDYPAGMKTDELGNFYFCDAAGNRIRKVNSSGIITTICGTGTAGYSVDGTAATAALLNEPLDIAIDRSGNVLYADYNNALVRIIESGKGIPTFVDGHHQTLNICENSSAVSLNSILAVSDTDHGLTETWVLRVPPANGTAVVSYSVTTTGSTLTPVGLYYVPNVNYSGVDSFKLFVNNGYSYDSTTIVVNIKSFFAGLITSEPAIVCPGGTVTFTDDTSGGVWSSSNTAIATVSGGLVTGASAGNAVISYTITNSCGTTSSLAEVRVGDPIISTYAGTGTAGYTGDGGAATAAEFSAPHGISVDPTTGYIYIADVSNNVVRKIDPSTGIITTIAGTGAAGYSRDGFAATTAELNSPFEVLADGLGNVYIADINNYRVRKVNSAGIISTFAGTGTSGLSGVGVAATAAELLNPAGLAMDASGNIYIGDKYVIRMVNTSGIISTYAGIGTAGFSGDNGPATAAQFNNCAYLRVDPSGNVVIEDNSNQRIRKINAYTGIITTIVGTGALGNTGDGGPATAATLDYPAGMAFDGAGNLYLASDAGEGVRMVNNQGTISTVAGNGTAGYSGDGGAATAAMLHTTVDVAFDDSGNMFIADQVNNVIRKVTTTAPAVAAISGATSVCQLSTIGLTDATAGGVWSSSNTSVATVGSTGAVYGVAAGTTIVSYSVTYPCGVLSATKVVTVNPFAPVTTEPAIVCPGNTITLSDAISGGTWSSSSSGIATVSSGGAVLGVTAGNAVITYAISGGCNAYAVVTVGTPIISTIAGNGSTVYAADGVPATSTAIDPNYMVSDAAGNIYISDYNNNRVRKVNTSGVISTFAGNGTPGWAGDGGAATAAELYGPTGMCFDAAGNLYICDILNNVIRKVNTSGIITTIAGTNTLGHTGDGGPATSAEIADPYGITVDPSGNVYFTDYFYGSIRKVNTSGIISTFVNSSAIPGFSGDGGPASAAQLYKPEGVFADRLGNIFIADGDNYRVRKVNPANIITTVAGTGATSYTGDGGQATAATFSYISHIYVDAAENIFIADDYNNVVREVNNVGIIKTIAGTGTPGYTGDGGAATAANLNLAFAICEDPSGNIVICDNGNDRIRKITPSDPLVSAISGPSIVCDGSTIQLTDATSGGTWSSSNTVVASVGSGTGIVTGITSGTTNITYSVPFSCGTLTAIQTVTVNANPAAISPATASVCQGSTTVLTDATTGGTWSSSASATASVVGGTVTGTTVGTATITYAISSCISTATVTVNAAPSAISGSLAICNGSTTTLTSSPSTGTWSSSNTSVAVIGASSGTVDAASVGTSIITYKLASGCYSTATETVTTTPSAISGLSTVCAGSGISLTDLPSGGTWSSSNGAVGSISSSGSLTGISAGTTSITYSLGTGCTASKIVTVNATPGPLFNSATGATSMCVGASTVFDSTTALGTWSSSNGSVLSIGGVPTSGYAIGVAAGTATISYTLSDGCYATLAFTVNPLPGAVTGVMSVCVGAATLLSSTPTGGTWSSGGSGATVNSGSGLVTGVSAGTTTVSYSLGTGCSASAVVTVNPTPAVISGTNNVCVGSSTSLTDGTSGGAWSSSTTAASVSGGTVTGVAAGTTTISYTLLSTGCYSTLAFTVNPIPSAITGVKSVCTGSTTLLGSTPTGGTWSSSNTDASVNSSGLVSGVTAGTATITYSLGTGCTALAVVTVNATPSAITGTTTLCSGGTSLLSSTPTGGSWTSSNSSVASIGSSSGSVTAVTNGTAIITYTLASGCQQTTVFTVNTAPSGITGSLAVCVGSTTSLGNTVSGGTWSSANTSVATIGSANGIALGVAAGTTSITYNLGAGCLAAATLTVNGNPAAITPSTSVSICPGASTVLTDVTPLGSFTSSNATIATVGGSSGIVTGVSAGTATISYTVSTGCYALKTVTVSIGPSAISPASPLVCVGGVTDLTDGVTGGTWASANLGLATVGSGSGIVSGVAAGTVTITYAIGTCTATTTVTVSGLLSAGVITGTTAMCVTTPITLADASGSGVWSSSNTSVATIGSASGIVSGVSGGTVIISYAVTNSCGTAVATTTVTVSILGAGTILGSASVCSGTFATYTDAVSGGTWSLSNTNASITGGGLVTGITPGTDVITYTINNTCGSFNTTKLIFIGSYLTAGSIFGSNTVCAGSSVTLTDLAPGGLWSASNADVSIGTGSGFITGVSAGVDTISYTVSSTCGSAYAIHTVTVLPLAVAGSITGPASICLGATPTYTDVATGGTWSVANATATISTSGVVTPVSAGSNTISYSVTNTCGTALATETINIGALLTAGTISGTSSNVCVGSAITLTDGTTGGVWGTSNGDATVSGGTVTGVTAGTVTVSYTVSAACGSISATYPVTVIALPVAGSITGPANLCTGSPITYTDAAGGGVWSVANTTATITGGGLVTPVSVGTNIISYTVTNSCGTAVATQNITIGTGPSAGTISGPTLVCSGTPITLVDGASGGTWSAANTDATVSSSGSVTGVTAGTDIISYSVTNGCGTAAATYTVTVSITPAAAAISGPSGLCLGSPFTYTDASTGGVWSISNASASISGGGLVTPITAGIDTISYAVSGSCGSAVATKTVSINTSVTAGTISGPGSICIGSPTTFTDGITGGIWNSSNLSVASVGSGTGVVMGLSIGTATISYTITNSCGTAMTTMTVSSGLAPYAGTISGLSSICAGSNTLYTDVAPGGTWGVTNASGSITSGGLFTATTTFSTDTITYTVTDACGTATATHTVSIGTLISTGSITGVGGVCLVATTTLSDAAGGGSWFSSNPSVATINPISGLVTGVAAGTALISYSVTLSCGTSAATTLFTVNSSPSAGTITGLSSVCDGSMITLLDLTSGGTWSASNSNASVSSGGAVTGLTPGTDVISYTVTNYCGTASATTTLTIDVFPVTAVISGPPSVCPGANITLTDGVTGGVWSASNGNAYIGSVTGIVTGIVTGTDDISYTVTNACGVASTGTILVISAEPIAGTITGEDSVCIGATTNLTDVVAGGTWSVGNSNATISTGGVVTGITDGTDPVTYTVTNSCGTAQTTSMITVGTTADPGVISGLSAVCAGSGITLTESVTGGTWIAGNANAVVAGPGVIDGVTVGLDTIFYAVSNSCGTFTTSKILAINPVPMVTPVAGPTTECPGTTITMTDASTDGIWTSSNPGVATVGLSSGIVTGVSAGTSQITYTVTNSYGCPTSVTANDTVIVVPVIPAIAGSLNVCSGASVTLSDVDAGGVWSSGDPSVATIDPTSGLLAGVTTGTVTISYSVVNICGVSTVTRTETVSLLPTVAAITGAGSVCAGSSVTLGDITTGGAWSSSDAAIATVGSVTGIVNGVSAGTGIIDYTVTNACGAAMASATITVNPLPDAGVISGASAICIGSAITLTDATSGGVWSAGNADATVSGGVVTGVTAGIDPVSYTVTNSCGSVSAVLDVTVNSFPVVDSVLGPSSVCGGGTITLTDATTGGVWSSSNSGATVSGGVVTGVTAGTDTIIYTVSNACATVAAIHIITINPAPDAGSITGASSVCVGATITLADGATGGSWGSTNADATVSAGVVRGASTGTDTIYYSVTNACGTTRAEQIITVNSSGAGSITGLSGVCVGATVTLADAVPGGTWTASNGSATVAGGVVTGVSSGTDTIVYAVTNSCGTATAEKVISVNVLPGAGTITGASAVCVGRTITLADVITGGVWSSTDTKATVSGGVVTGVTPGTDTIKYAASNGCGAAMATKLITINPNPYAGSISGEPTVCPGLTVTLTDAVLGGVWGSSNTTAATVSDGIVTGVAAGTATINYTVSNSCGSVAATYPVTVLPAGECNTGVGIIMGTPDKLNVYPNPNPGAFTMNLVSVNDEAVRVTITNVLGEKVLEFTTVTNKETDIKIPQAAGIYLLSATTETGKYMAKVTVE